MNNTEIVFDLPINFHKKRYKYRTKLDNLSHIDYIIEYIILFDFCIMRDFVYIVYYAGMPHSQQKVKDMNKLKLSIIKKAFMSIIKNNNIKYFYWTGNYADFNRQIIADIKHTSKTLYSTIKLYKFKLNDIRKFAYSQ